MKVVDGCPYRCDPGRPAASCPHCAGLEPKALKGTHGPSAGRRPAPWCDRGPCGRRARHRAGPERRRQGVRAGAAGRAPIAALLYIDEVNLLEDHLVDLLLDVAASGENVVEREGSACAILPASCWSGQGNPEEGEFATNNCSTASASSVVVRTPVDVAGARRGRQAAGCLRPRSGGLQPILRSR